MLAFEARDPVFLATICLSSPHYLSPNDTYWEFLPQLAWIAPKNGQFTQSVLSVADLAFSVFRHGQSRRAVGKYDCLRIFRRFFTQESLWDFS